MKHLNSPLTQNCLLVFCLHFFLLTPKLYAQQDLLQKATDLYKQGEKAFFVDVPTAASDEDALKNYQAVIELYETADTHHLLEAESYQKIGSIYLGQRMYDSARNAYHKAIQIKAKLPQLADSVFYKEYIFLGNLHALTERPDSAEWYYLKAVDIANAYPNIDEVERAYNSLGVFYKSTGNYYQAINFCEKALSVLKEDDVDFLNATVSFTYNIAKSKTHLYQYEEAISSYRKLLAHGLISERIFLELGNAYGHTKQYDSAYFFLNKAVQSDSPYILLDAYNTLASIAAERNVSDSATYFYQRTIDTSREYFGFKNSSLASAYIGLASVALQKQNYEEALEYYQFALINSNLSFSDLSVQNNPSQLDQSISLLTQFRALKGKAAALKRWSLASSNGDLLQQSLHTYQQAVRTARYIQRTYDNDEAKLFLVQNIYPVYEEAIQTAYQLYKQTKERQYAEIAFQYSEQSKAAVLSEILDELEIKSSGLLSDSLIQAEKRQKQQIAQLRLQLIEARDSVQLSSLQQNLNENEIALARTAKSLQKDAKYYRLKYQEDSLDVNSLQQNILGKKDALLEYFIGQDSLYTFFLSKEKFAIKAQALDSTFYQAIAQVQAHLYDYEMGQAYEQYKQAYLLYQFLLLPFEQELAKKERLIIVPDGQLNYIPFEMLSYQPEADQYLLYKHAVSYAYSAQLLEEAISTRKNKESDQVLAMAPFAGDEEGNIRSNGFNLLFGSKEEVENIGGSIYLENQATKRLFLELVSSYGVIHLATHASIDNNNPLESFIAFYPDDNESLTGYRLYTQELYNLQLDSVKLVVLSACEAGNGQLVKGEGIISLARAFAYAGCPNIITTLWKAQDKSTAILASSLHHYLKEGYTKDQALRQAKLDYLNSDEIHPLLKTPYYWANFIFIGDTVPIYESPKVWLWWLLAGLLVVVGLYLLLKKLVFKP
ncbi:CHAT domain-containing protein [Porifericola rhodea]|uniref:CHAT domain-containing protein n=1 Tax=Porifericola rhodea TaxID=930972 RepID=UPI00266652C3|nr:CHAT domain-containing protein [Porifericola rhodea]WKN30245.1 CHAT domain-containing protein [Porifericola rhodea]